MKQKLKFFAKLFAPIVLLASPLFARAIGDITTGLGYISSRFGITLGGISNATSLTQLIQGIIRLLLTFAGAVAVLFIIIGGFWYITSGGNEETAEKGKKTLINAIIGIVVIVLAYAIVNVVVNTIERGY